MCSSDSGDEADAEVLCLYEEVVVPFFGDHSSLIAEYVKDMPKSLFAFSLVTCLIFCRFLRMDLNVEIYSSTTMRAIIDHKWNHGIRRLFLKEVVWFSSIWLFFVAASLFPHDLPAELLIACLVWVLLGTTRSIVKTTISRSVLPGITSFVDRLSHTNGFYFVEPLTNCVVAASVVLKFIALQTDTNDFYNHSMSSQPLHGLTPLFFAARNLEAFGHLLLSLRIFYFLQISPSHGHLVQMVMSVLNTAFSFFLMVVIVAFGFAMFFFTLFRDSDDLWFGRAFGEVFLVTLSWGLLGEHSLESVIEYWPSFLCFLFFGIALQVILLNMVRTLYFLCVVFWPHVNNQTPAHSERCLKSSFA